MGQSNPTCLESVVAYASEAPPDETRHLISSGKQSYLQRIPLLSPKIHQLIPCFKTRTDTLITIYADVEDDKIESQSTDG